MYLSVIHKRTPIVCSIITTRGQVLSLEQFVRNLTKVIIVVIVLISLAVAVQYAPTKEIIVEKKEVVTTDKALEIIQEKLLTLDSEIEALEVERKELRKKLASFE